MYIAEMITPKNQNLLIKGKNKLLYISVHSLLCVESSEKVVQIGGHKDGTPGVREGLLFPQQLGEPLKKEKYEHVNTLKIH